MLSTTFPNITAAVDSVYRANWSRIADDFDMAKKAAQEAFIIAMTQCHEFPRDYVPR